MSFSALASIAATPVTEITAEIAQTAPESTQVPFVFQFTASSLQDTLPVMLKGMLGIFAVTAIILLAIALLSGFSKRKTRKVQ